MRILLIWILTLDGASLDLTKYAYLFKSEQISSMLSKTSTPQANNGTTAMQLTF